MTKDIFFKIITSIIIGLCSLSAQSEGDVDAIEKARQAYYKAAKKARQEAKKKMAAELGLEVEDITAKSLEKEIKGLSEEGIGGVDGYGNVHTPGGRIQKSQYTEYNNQNNRYQLPRIPIYVNGGSSNLIVSEPFVRTNSESNSFYDVTIEELHTKTGSRLFRIFASASSGIFFSYLSGIYDENIRPFGAFYGGLIAPLGYFHFGDKRNLKRRTSYALDIYKGSEKVFEGKKTVKKPGSMIIKNSHNNAWFIMGWAIPYSFAIPIHYTYKNKEVETPVIDPVKIDTDDLKFLSKTVKKYKDLYEEVKVFNSEYDRRPLKKEMLDEFKVFGKKKGEFETSLDYQNRLKKERISKQKIRAEFSQKIAKDSADFEIKKLKKLRKFRKKINKVSIEKQYAYTFSDYNADYQQFVLNIEGGKKKKINVPLKDAEKFKKKTKDGSFVVKNIYNPTLEGEWVPIYDEVVLAEARTGKIIPFENKIPSLARSVSKNPPKIIVSLELYEPSGEGFLDADEKAKLKVHLENVGKGNTGDIVISLSQNSGETLTYDFQKKVRPIKKMGKSTTIFDIIVPYYIKNGKATFEVSFLEEQGYEPEPLKMKVDLRASKAPQLALVDYDVFDNDEDGKLSKGELATITLRIQNQGQGNSKNVIAMLKPLDENAYIQPGTDNEIQLGNIGAGAFEDAKFYIQTNNRVKEQISYRLDIVEKRKKFSKVEIIKLDINKKQRQLRDYEFTGTQENIAISDVSGNFSIDIEKNIPETGMKNRDAIAVIIGNRDYSGDVPNVDFAVRDAQFVKEYLIKTMGYRDGNIFQYNNATKAQIGVAFKKLKNAVKPNKSDVFVYYSGHGAPDPDSNQGYFVPVDADPNYIMESGYPVNDLYKLLKQTNARNTTVVIDACFSGSSDQGMILKDISPVFIEVDDSFLDSKNSAVFTSATGEQVSSWYRDKRHSLFTYYFLKGLQGEADLNRDGKLVLSEMKNYIDEKVPYNARLINNREQEPQLMTDDESRVLVKY